MGLSSGTKLQLYELPKQPTSIFSALANLLGVHAQAQPSLTDLPAVREVLRNVPASVVVSPDGAQARLPFDISWE
jgi:hypothetical protein